MVKWVAEHAEDYDNLLYQVDQELARDKKVRLVLFDGLDRLADDWQGIRPLARALFQLALDLRSSRALRLKLLCAQTCWKIVRYVHFLIFQN